MAGQLGTTCLCSCATNTGDGEVYSSHMETTSTSTASATAAAGRSRSQQVAETYSHAEAEGGHAGGAALAGHAICTLELRSRGCSSGHRGVCSLRKANRAAECPRGGGAERNARQKAATSRRRR
jgi:hypothetical protein